MLKLLLASKPAVAVTGALAAAYIGLVYATSRIKREPEDTDAKLFSQHPQILAMWHGQFLLLPKLKPKRPADVRAMISRHGDALLIGDVLERFGLSLIRGAGAGKRKRDRGGATAWRESLRALTSGATVAMTADVPPGPARRAGEGIGTLASLSGRPVVPFAIATNASSPRPPGAPSPSTFPSRRLPSSSAIRCSCRKPTTRKSSSADGSPSKALSPKPPRARMLWQEHAIP
jgi:3-deoxy-D-manno-octulosonic-acid transferase